MVGSSLAIFFAGLVSLTGAYAQVAAWHSDVLAQLSIERLDPIINPNGVAQHMHQIVGGSGFNAAYNFNDLRNSKCTTVGITADKSNYWMPKLYWMNGDGSFTPLPGGHRFYYFLGRSSGWDPVKPFPEGLRMLVGDPNSKSFTGHVSFTCVTNSDLSTDLLYGQTWNAFNRDCPYGLKIEAIFPQCWDGVNLYKSDQSHMAYPVNSGSDRVGPCPMSHPVRVPQIMLEYTFNPSRWAPGKTVAGNLVFANGDTTGYGAHADFTNGWDTAVLGAALNNTQCAGSIGSMPIQSCEVLRPYYNPNAAYACKLDRAQANEPGSSNTDLVPIDTLPGCNLKWASGAKPTCSTAPPNPDISGRLGTNGALVAAASAQGDLKLPTTPGWQQIACIKDTSNMLLGGGGHYYDTQVTATSCTANCQRNGYNYAIVGMRDGRWDCACGTGIDPLAQSYPGACTTACPGAASEICGASSVHSVYYAPNGTTVNNTASTANGTDSAYYLGCYAPSGTTSLTVLNDFTYEDAKMTNDLCLQTCANRNMTWSATGNGKRCYCGKNYDIGSGWYVNQATCNFNCVGDATQRCGYAYGVSVYNVTASPYKNQNKVHPAGWKGCFSDPGMNGLKGYSWTGSMTPEKCTYGCAELGFKLAGLVMGNRCKCDNDWKGGAEYPSISCDYQCDGAANQTCGGYYNTELYDTSIASDLVAKDIAARPPGWLGCYANSNGLIFKDYYSYDGQLTPLRCKQTCNTYGYSFAGLANQYYCRCTSVDPATVTGAAKWPSNIFCTSPCPGDSKNTCGAPNQFTDAYNVSASTAVVNKTGPAGYLGCYSGVAGLNGPSWSQSQVSVELCTAQCKEQGYSLTGLSGSNCYCGNNWSSGGLLPDTSCTSKCPGNSTQICGGYYITSLYNTSIGADTNQAPGYLGCYTDSSGGRTLTGYSYSSSVMTNSICRATCSNRNFSLFGTTGGVWCFCGNAISNGQSRTASSLCTAPCGGDSKTICGSTAWRISVYNVSVAGTTPSTPSGSVSGSASVSINPSASASATTGGSTSQPTSKGCYADVSTLNAQTYSTGYMTVDTCVTYCKSTGYAFAGLTAGNTCRCGNTSPATVAGRALCNTPCVSNSAQMCGGPSQIDVWATTQSSSFVDLYSAASADSKGYMGCWGDWTPRLLADTNFQLSNLTPQTCLANCIAQGYTFSGVQNGNQCFCAKSLTTGTGLKRMAESNCFTKCNGDSNQVCGGSWRINIYVRPSSGSVPSVSASSASATATVSVSVSRSSSATASASASPSTAAIEGYQGCYGTGSFTSGSASVTGNGQMNTGFCRRYCRSLGYAAAGLNAGNNCYCGATNQLGTKLSDSACTNTCAGNSAQKCGDAFMVSVYDTVGDGARTLAGYPANYVGCYKDWTPRLLGNYTVSSSSMTADNCRRICSVQGFTTYGTQSGNQCFCGTGVPQSTTVMTTEGDCSYSCSGAATEKCGGNWRLSLYDTKFPVSGPFPAAGSAEPSSSSAASSSTSQPASSASTLSTSSARPASSSVAAPTSSSQAPASSIVPPSSSQAAASSSAAPTSSSQPASSAAAPTSSSAAASSIGGGLNADPTSSVASNQPVSASSGLASPSVVSSSTVDGGASTSSSPIPSPSATSSAAPSSVAPSQAPSSAPAPSSQAPSPSSEAPSSSVNAPSSSTVIAAPASTSSYLGCYTQPSPPVLDQSVITCDVLTPAMCKVWCNANSLAYAGMTNSTTCGCANDITALTQVDASQCNADCFNDRSAKCGSRDSTSAYSVWRSSGLIQKRLAHRRRMRAGQHGLRRQQHGEILKFNSEKEILDYLEKRS